MHLRSLFFFCYLHISTLFRQKQKQKIYGQADACQAYAPKKSLAPLDDAWDSEENTTIPENIFSSTSINKFAHHLQEQDTITLKNQEDARTSLSYPKAPQQERYQPWNSQTQKLAHSTFSNIAQTNSFETHEKAGSRRQVEKTIFGPDHCDWGYQNNPTNVFPF